MAEHRTFSERWRELALHDTVQVAADATISAKTLAKLGATGSHTDSDPLAATLAADSQADEAAEATAPVKVDTLPRISLARADQASKSLQGELQSADLELQSLIGEGGMGQVHQAQQHSLRRKVAVKTLKEGATAASRAALISEARVTGFLAHPGIIPVHSLGIDTEGEPVLVMKQIEGHPWRELIHRDDHPAWSYWEARSEERLVAHLEILAQVCDALHFAHSQGVVHLDIKPENIMLGRFGEVYLVDWGLASKLPCPASGQLQGTPAYMPPEMALGEALDERSDIFLLGATLHEVLTKSFRHQGSTLKEILEAASECAPPSYGDEVPHELAELCTRATARDPAVRPASADDFRRAITDYLHHRNSVRLSEAASERLEEARGLDGGSELAPEEAYKMGTRASEARFGFEQALDIWRDNPHAIEGLEESQALLARSRIHRGDLLGARDLLEKMRAPSDELREELAALEEKLAREEEERARLERLDKELDDSVAAGTRTLAYIVMAAVVLGISMYFLLTGKAQTLSNEDTAAVSIVVWVVTGIFIALRRKQLLANTYNRRAVAIFMLSVMAMTANRIVGWIADIEVQHILSTDLVILFLGTGAAATALMRWMKWMCLCFLGGVPVVALLSSAHAPAAFSAVTTFSLIVGYLGWRGEKRTLTCKDEPD